jgi:hypothetical protein
MNHATDAWLRELRAHPTLSPAMVAEIEAELFTLDRQADDCPDAAVVFDAVSWIVGHQNRSVAERFAALVRLIKHDGSEIEMHAFTGWYE